MKSLRLLNSDLTATVDDEDFDAVAAIDWRIQKRGRGLYYVRSQVAGGNTNLHLLIAKRMGIVSPKVDHRDGNALNNCRANLRGATSAQNAWNARHPLGSSGHPGVQRNRQNWSVRFEHCGETMYFGTFRSLDEAKVVATREMVRLRGEFYCPAEVRRADHECHPREAA